MVTNVRHRLALFSLLAIPLRASTGSFQHREQREERHHARPEPFLLLYGFNKSPRGNSRRVGPSIKPTDIPSTPSSIVSFHGMENEMILLELTVKKLVLVSYRVSTRK